MSVSGWRWLDGHSMLVMSATSGLKMWVVDIALHDLFSGEQTMVLDFKGFLGAVLLESCSVHFGYTECVSFIGLHFPPECVPSIGLHLPRIQSNDLSYTASVSHVSSPTICPTWNKQMSYSVTFYHTYVFIVGFPAIIPTSCILRAVYADLL